MKRITLSAIFLISCFACESDNILSPKPKPKPISHTETPLLSVKDPRYQDQWYLKNTGQGGGVVGLDLNIEPVWKMGYLGKDMQIVVLDDAVDEKHPDLKENIASVTHYGDLRKSCDGATDHGTPVAGIIASKDNEEGVIGVAPRSKIHFRNVFNRDGSENDLVNFDDFSRALGEKTESIAVLNASIGASAGFYLPESLKLHEGIDKGIKEGFNGKGTSYVIASGNTGFVYLLASNALAAHPGVIAVSGVTKKGEISPFGVTAGAQHWVSAFTKDILAPDLSDDGVNKCGYDLGDYTNFAGTSAATPMVAGVVALIRQANPNLTYRDVKLILAATARRDKVASSYRWDETGTMYGDAAKKYKYNQYLGFGMVDAEAAVALAKKWALLPAQKTATYSSNSANRIPLVKEVAQELTIPIRGSGINFVEFVQLAMTFEGATEHTATLDMELSDPAGNTFKIMRSNKIFAYFKAGDNLFLTGYNKYLGKQSPDGDWRIKIKTNRDGILAVKDVKIKIYGH